MLGFVPLTNYSVTAEFSFLLSVISTIISSKTINNFLFYVDCNLQYFVDIQHII